MKYTILSVLLMSVLVSCSSQPQRQFASKEYECSFKDQDSKFVFTPESMKLRVNDEVIALEEDNFIKGGFSYVQEKGVKNSQWPVKKIEFLSFSTTPMVTVSFKRTPASKSEVTFTKYCE